MKTPRLDNLLDSSRSAVRWAGLLAWASRAALAGVLLLLLTLTLDALLGLPPSGLMILNLLMLTGLCAGVLLLIKSLVARFDRRLLAKTIESRLAIADNRLLNAVELADAAGAMPARTSLSLIDLAVRQGDEAALAIPAQAAIDLRAARRGAAMIAFCLMALAISYLIAPRVFHAVIPRLISPSADHPPYSLVDFQITTEPDRIFHAKPASISAQVSGPILPVEASVVFTDRQPRQTVPMIRTQEGQFVLRIDRTAESRPFFISTPQGRSKLHQLVVLPEPLIEQVQVTYDPPVYTGRKSESVILLKPEIKALRGTKITLDVRSNLPLNKGWITLVAADSNGQTLTFDLQPAADQPDRVRGTFGLPYSGQWQLVLEGHTGDQSLPMTGEMVALEDGAPSVRIQMPEKEAMAPENFVTPVIASAEDDLGIAGLTLHATLIRAGTKTALAPQPLQIVQKIPLISGIEARGGGGLDLPAMKAQPGDTIEYYVTARDSHPDSPQEARSPIHKLTIISAQEYEKIAKQNYSMQEMIDEVNKLAAELQKLQQERQALAQQIEQLKKSIDAGPEAVSPEDQQQLQKLAEKMNQLGETTKELAQKLKEQSAKPSLYEAEKKLREQIGQMASTLAKQGEESEQAGQSIQQAAQGKPSPSQPQASKALADALAGLKKATGDSADQNLTERQLAEQAEKIQLAAEIAARLMLIVNKIAPEQKALADELATLVDVKNPNQAQQKRAAKLADTQRELQQTLDQTLKELMDLAGKSAEKLPKMSQSVVDIVMEIRDDDVLDDMKQAADHADAHRFPEAHTKAASAAGKLLAMIAKCQSGECESAAADLDGAVKLTLPGMNQDQLTKTLNEMAKNLMNQMPCPSINPGQGGGQGIGAGDGSSAQRAGGQKGTQILGPNINPNKQRNNAKYTEKGGQSKLQEVHEPDAGQDTPGDLNVEDPSRPHRAAGPTRVPLRWRDKAADYFRRLSEDAAPAGEKR